MSTLQSQIDRLVDGELPPEERRALLEQLDSEPSRWRDCALSFVEAQTMRKALSTPEVRCETPSEIVMSRNTEPVQPQSSGRWLALAASLAFAFAAGLTWQGSPADINDSPPIADVSNPPASVNGVALPSAGEEFSLGDENTLVVWTVDREGNRQSLNVPLVEAAWIDEQLAAQYPESGNDELVCQLNQNGYELKSRRRYAPLMFGNSEPFLLPVDDNQIVQVAHPIY